MDLVSYIKEEGIEHLIAKDEEEGTEKEEEEEETKEIGGKEEEERQEELVSNLYPLKYRLTKKCNINIDSYIK